MTGIKQLLQRKGYLALVAIMASSGLVAGLPVLQVAATTCTTLHTLSGSNFEIDAAVPNSSKLGAQAGANLTLDGLSPCVDWSTKAPGAGTGTTADLTTGVIVKADKPSGTGDDSFGQGTSENDPNPTIVSGSIPPNKSDLQDFGIFKELTINGRFLNLFWSRINSPSGTVTMDFELNKLFCDPSATPTNCAFNGKGVTPETPLRSNNDRLIVFALASGGVVPTLSIYHWSGNSTSGSWMFDSVISGGSSPEALGSINFSAIAAIDSAGLGAKDPLTFGEASIDFKAIFSGITGCGSFGSVYLKSRSSNTFTDELKDFIAPQPVTITNCTSLTTNATAGPVTIGGSISDTATLAGAISPTGTVTFTAYSAAGCAVSSLVFTSSAQTLTGPDGSGNFSATASFIPTAAGTYFWIASFSGDPNNAASMTKCGDPNESSVVGPKTPMLHTTAGAAVSVGNAVSDSAMLAGTANKPNGNPADGSITFTLFGPSASPSCTAQNLVFTSSAVTVNGDGTYGPVTFTPKAAGTYYWIAVYTGDSPNTLGASTSCGDTGETSVVNPLQPTIFTNASPSVTIGQPISDTATLGGTANKPDGTAAGGTITFTAFFNDNTCLSLPVFTSSAVPVNGNGTYDSATFTPTDVGTYFWIAAYTGDPPNTLGVSTSCGAANEASVVNKASPPLSSSPTLTPQDSATLTGIVAGGSPQATITFSLFGPTDLSCSNAPVFSSGLIPVPGNGTYNTSNTTFTLDSSSPIGIYRWVVAYSGDSRNNANGKACGVESFDFEGATASAAS